jgi:hypothetical protein
MKEKTDAPANQRPFEPQVLGRPAEINYYKQNIYDYVYCQTMVKSKFCFCLFLAFA